MDYETFRIAVRNRVMEIEDCSKELAEQMLSRFEDTVINNEYYQNVNDDDIDYAAKEIVCYYIG